MLKGRSLQELAMEIQRRKEMKRDFLVDTQSLEMFVDELESGRNVGLRLPQPGNFADLEIRINNIAHRQIGQKTGIPTKYYDRMLQDNPELLAYNVNTWMHQEPTRRMVRTLDGNARVDVFPA